jgi:hypothetical protein
MKQLTVKRLKWFCLWEEKHPLVWFHPFVSDCFDRFDESVTFIGLREVCLDFTVCESAYRCQLRVPVGLRMWLSLGL